jgi:hypothetical protein
MSCLNFIDSGLTLKCVLSHFLSLQESYLAKNFDLLILVILMNACENIEVKAVLKLVADFSDIISLTLPARLAA